MRRVHSGFAYLLLTACLLGLMLSHAQAAPRAKAKAKKASAASAYPSSVTPEALFVDWITQDTSNKEMEKYFVSDKSSKLEKALLKKVLTSMGIKGRAFRKELGSLTRSKAPGNDPKWKALYVSVCQARRLLRLAPLLKQWKKIAYAEHYVMGGSHYAYTEGQSDAQRERHFQPYTELVVLELDAKGQVTKRVLIHDERGVIRDVDVSYDGKRLLFAWKKERKDDYHLYEYNLEADKVRQMTFGKGFADYEGCYLPNGNIVFSSSRCVQTVDCWWTEVSNMYMCDAEGRFLRRIGFDQVHTNYPTVTPGGKVSYTRWEYNDRGQLYPQPLFEMNLDGTGQTATYGNNSWFPTTIIHARGIPAPRRKTPTGKLLAIATGHHSKQAGKLIRIDPSKGTEETAGITLLAPVSKPTGIIRIDSYGQGGDWFQYPYPLSETTFLVSAKLHREGRRNINTPQVRPFSRKFGLYLMDETGQRELLAYDKRQSIGRMVPVAPRVKPLIRPSMVDHSKKTGTYYMQNVYFGPGMKGVPRGAAKRLRVASITYRAAGVGANNNGGPGGGALVSTPVACPNGTWDPKIILGSVPIEKDGSAFVEVPARMPIYFQVLDKNNHVIQTMRSWSTLQPGENFACIGCHEGKNDAPPSTSRVTLAMRKGPRPLKPLAGVPTDRGLSFPQDIQPILDKHCIRCHDDSSKKMPGRRTTKRKIVAKPGQKAFSLLGKAVHDGRAKRNWSEAYQNLTQKGRPSEMVKWMNVQSIPPMLPPYFAGACKSQLIALLREGHNRVKLSKEEYDKIACWIDMLVPYCGDYFEANTWNEGEMRKYTGYQAKRDAMASREAKNIQALINYKKGRKIDPAQFGTRPAAPWAPLDEKYRPKK